MSETLPKVLTFYLTKNRIIPSAYYSVLNQKFVDQKIIIVSAEPVDMKENFVENFVITPPKDWATSFRVSYSINAAIKKYWNDEFDYLLKVDDDVLLLTDEALNEMIKKMHKIYGTGPLILIDKSFFIENGRKYPFSNLDDMYLFALAAVKGYRKQAWVSDERKNIFLLREDTTLQKTSFAKQRAIQVGMGFYEIGYPWFICIFTSFIFFIKIEFIKSKIFFYFFIGYSWAKIRRNKRVSWHKRFHTIEFQNWLFEKINRIKNFTNKLL